MNNYQISSESQHYSGYIMHYVLCDVNHTVYVHVFDLYSLGMKYSCDTSNKIPTFKTAFHVTKCGLYTIVKQCEIKIHYCVYTCVFMQLSIDLQLYISAY